MKRTISRIAGMALIVAGIAGLIFSIVGLVVLGRVQQTVESAILENLQLVDQALTATAEGLTVTQTSLQQATNMIQSAAQTTSGVGQALDDTVPTVDAVADFLGEQLPATIKSTQETLLAAAATAKIIDDAMAVITVIPLLGTDRYSPEVPFHQGLVEVSTSLEAIPNSLGSVQEGLNTAGNNLQDLSQQLSVMAGQIDQIASSVESAEVVLAQYQGIIADLQGLTASIHQGIPKWLDMLRLALSLALVWLGLAQIGLLTQGWELIGRSRRTEDTRKQMSE
jgi:peptidoglycan hydrolase CwlO-like protein